MSIKSQRSLLFVELQSPRNVAVFAEARKQRQEFSTCETPHELLQALKVESRHDLPEKERLARAVLHEHAVRPHPLWAALLLLACHPMLSRLRGRLYSEHAGADELDQLVVAAFLEVAADYAAWEARDRTFMHLRQLTHRQVFRLLRREQQAMERVQPVPPSELRQHERICLGEHRYATWPETRPDAPSSRERNQQVAFLKRHGRSIQREKLDPMIATLVRGERLRQYVRRVYPHLDGAEHQRLYELVKRRHTRGLSELRALLEHRRPPSRIERSEVRR